MSARVGGDVVASTVMRLIASRTAVSKADLVRRTGLSRTTIDAALRQLGAARAVRRCGLRAVAGRGRPAEELEIVPEFVTVTLPSLDSA